MLRTKDFSHRFSYDVKTRVILDYFLDTGDEDVKEYVKKNFIKTMKMFIEDGDIERINQIIDKTEFVTKRNIDKFLTTAIDSKQQEIFITLTNYKNKIGAYKTLEEEFKL